MMKSLVYLLTLVAATNAHMIMRSPVPAGKPNNSPLDAQGADFPCKRKESQFDVSAGPDNPAVSPGGTFKLSFTGSAVHGGGSCQVSLAKGWSVTKDTKFMVIHSIEGGCPANVAQNIEPENAENTAGLSEYDITVPDHPDLPAGQYTMAWTWHNNVGNREMYMNCAQFTIGTGGSASNTTTSKRSAAPLPDLFKANIGNGCTTVEGGAVQYPDPGESPTVLSGAKLIPPNGNCGSPVTAQGSTVAASSDTGAAATASSAAANSPSPAMSSSASSSSVATSAVATGSTSDFAMVGSSSTAATSSTVASSSSASSVSTTASTPATSAAAPSTPSGASGSSTGGGACEKEGSWSCAADGGSFQRCVYGQWSVAINMAAGTKCVAGIGDTLQYAGLPAGPSKRHDHGHGHHHDV